MKEETNAEYVSTFSNESQTDFVNQLRNSKKGIECPCCGRKAKFYKRKLNHKLCLALIHITKWYRHHPSQPNQLDYFDYTELLQDYPELKVDFPKLQYWDLVEAKGSIKKRYGKEIFVKEQKMYRISENGVKFVQREVAIPITAVVYNNVVKGHQLNPHATIDKILEDAGYEYDNCILPDTTTYQQNKKV